MKIQEARKEILLRLRESCGFEIPEYRLSGPTRESIGALASTFRQLLALRQLVKLEEENDARLSSKLERKMHKRKDTDHKKHLAAIEAMRKDLDAKTKLLASQIVAELQSPVGAEASPLARSGASHSLLKPLKCPSCGADLALPTSGVTKCEFCGVSYTLEEYMDNLGTSMRS